MQASLILLGALMLPAAEPHTATVKASRDAVTLSNCLITLNDKEEVPAKEAGALEKIAVKDGDVVKAGQLLAQIDDAHAQAEFKANVFKHQRAKEESENDINVRYSVAEADVANAQVLVGEEANRRVAGSVTPAQLREWKLAHVKSVLGIEQSRFKMHTTSIEAQEQQAAVEAAQENINRRKILAKLDGVVVDLKKHEGEWVQPGDTLLRVVRIDRLRIEGFLNVSQYAPAEINRRPVTVTVSLAGGRQETFQGSVIFVDPQVEPGGEYRVRVVVYNRKENDDWLLLPGLNAEMTIHLK